MFVAKARQLARRRDRHVDRVEHHLGRQLPHDGMAEVSGVQRVGRIGLPASLIGVAVENLAVQPLHVVAVRDEPVGQIVQQFGVGRGIGDVQVIRRIDDAAVEIASPRRD